MPSRPPKLVYLDLNQWIELSKVHSGHSGGIEHSTVLEASLAAVETDRAVFPITETFYAEISKIRNHRQRRNLREVIERVSRYAVVLPLSVVAMHEIEASLDQLVGPSPRPITLNNYLDWGVNRAFGTSGNIIIRNASGQDVTESIRQRYPGGPESFDLLVAQAQLELNRRVIDGPVPDEEVSLRRLGWNPESTVRVYERRASDEREQVRRFNDFPGWRCGRMRDALFARELIVEIGDILTEGLVVHGINESDQFWSGRAEDIRAVFNSMPSFDVSVTLKESLHRDPMHRWTNNDIHDIKGLAVTIPYCDIVVTDREMRSHAIRKRLPERHNTVVLADLSDLTSHL